MNEGENVEVEKIIGDLFSSVSSNITSVARNISEENAFFFQESAVLSEVAEEVKSEEEDVQPAQDLFKSRMSCLKAWFMRCSSNVKLKCLSAILKRLHNHSHLGVILYTSNFNLDKLRVYSKCSAYTIFIHDKWLNDHNRSLDKRYLDETIKSDMAWFENLTDTQQMDVLIELLQISNGRLVTKFFEIARKLHTKRTNRQQKRKAVSSDAEKEGLLNASLVDKTTSLHTNMEVASTDTSSLAQQVRERSSKLEEAFADYMNVVFDIQEKGKRNSVKRNDKSGRNGSAGSGKKSARNNRRPSSASSNSSGNTRNGKDKQVVPQTVDEIQLLPIWIVKKIFGYLDQKTLKKAREVNTYWNYVVDDISKEKSCRKYINKVLRKMKNNINCLEMEDVYKPTQVTHVSGLEKRMLKLFERGAVHPKLRSGVYKTRDNTLIEKAAQEFQQKLKSHAPPEGYEGFPRNQPSDNALVKTPLYVLGEAGKQPYKAKSLCGTACMSVQKPSCDIQKGDDNHKAHHKSFCIQFS